MCVSLATLVMVRPAPAPMKKVVVVVGKNIPLLHDIALRENKHNGSYYLNYKKVLPAS